MTPDAEYSAQRYCPSCKVQTKVTIKLEQWTVFMTCNSCNATHEFECFERY